MSSRLLQLLAFVILFILAYLVSTKPIQAASTKSIEINLDKQHLYAYEDSQIVYDFIVSTGKTRTPTPTGGFWPWIKLRYDGMSGGSQARGDYYNLPNVPYVIYFYNEKYPKWRGYALHGTYWHNNFGHPMSHGCVNLKTHDMAKLYQWIDLPTEEQTGTVITVIGTTPQK